MKLKISVFSKCISAFLALAVSFSMTACANNTTDTSTSSDNNAEVSEVTTEAVSVPELTIPDNSIDMVKELKLGWNLGNTLDATGSGLASENAWGQPTTTQEMIDFVKESGFTTIRIPVSWSNHTDAEYNISENWMDRVEEVVNYAYNAGLYVIINSHHDNSKYYPSDEKIEESCKYLEVIWKQIAERFKDYDHRLIFEGMNEPRLEGTNKEWWFSSTDPEGVASIKCIVRLNQLFVDTVRASGGNNADRYLMVPSHAASADNALNDAFVMPTDTVENRLIVSVHAYSPYDFAMNANGYKEWDGSHDNELNFMDKLKTKFCSW